MTSNNKVRRQKSTSHDLTCPTLHATAPPAGQFPSTFVEAVPIPSTKAGDRLYVCINDFTSSEPGTLALKRGTVHRGHARSTADAVHVTNGEDFNDSCMFCIKMLLLVSGDYINGTLLAVQCVWWLCNSDMNN